MRYNVDKLIYSGFFGILLLTLLVAIYASIKLKQVSEGLNQVLEYNRPIMTSLRSLRSVNRERIMLLELTMLDYMDLRSEDNDGLKELLKKNYAKFESLNHQFNSNFTKLKISQARFVQASNASGETLFGLESFITDIQSIIIYRVIGSNKLEEEDINEINQANHRFTRMANSVFRELISGKPGKEEDKKSDLMKKSNFELRFSEEKNIDVMLTKALKSVEQRLDHGNLVIRSEASGGRQRIIYLGSTSAILSLLLAVIFSRLTRKMGKSIDAYVESKEVLSDLSELMRNKDSLEAVLDSALNFIARRVSLCQANYYHLVEDRLKLMSSYAFSDVNSCRQEYEMGQGWVGQSAEDQSVIHMKSETGSKIYVRHLSSDGEISMSDIVYFPVTHDETLLGVLEVYSIRSIDEDLVDLLKEVLHLLGISIHTVWANDKLKTLLKHSQMNEELIKKTHYEMCRHQEQLTLTNKALKEQTDKLMRSEQVLKQQSNELKESNSELESKQKSIKRQAFVLAAAKRSLETKTKELEVASKYKSEFLANMSHELRTPLNSMLVLSGDLADNREGNLTDEQREDAEVIHRCGEELLDLINDILDLSKVEAGKLDITLEDVNLKSIVQKMIALFKRQCEKKSLGLIMEISEEVPETIKSDVQRLEQILKNFLSNAVKFTSKGEIRLFITLDKQSDVSDKMVSFMVSDTGIGIPEEKQQAIFEAFQQTDSSISRKYGGTGLGLTIARRLSHLLGGKVTLTSEVGKGSTFSLSVPINWDGKPRTAVKKIKEAPTNNISTRVSRVEEKKLNSTVSKAKSRMSKKNFSWSDVEDGTLHNLNDSEKFFSKEKSKNRSNQTEKRESVESNEYTGKERRGVQKITESQSSSEITDAEKLGKPIVEKTETGREKFLKNIGMSKSNSPNVETDSRQRGEKSSRSRSTDNEKKRDIRFDGQQVLLISNDVISLYALSGQMSRVGLNVHMAENFVVATEKIEASNRLDETNIDYFIISMPSYVKEIADYLERIKSTAQFKGAKVIVATKQSISDEDKSNIQVDHYIEGEVNPEALIDYLNSTIQ